MTNYARPTTDMAKESLFNIMNNLYHFDEVSVLDLRDHEWTIKGDIIVDRKELQGDPLGSVVCDLSSCSEFVGKDVGKLGFFGADYNQQETNEAHSYGKHLYKVSRSVLEADVFIKCSKTKIHMESRQKGRNITITIDIIKRVGKGE